MSAVIRSLAGLVWAAGCGTAPSDGEAMPRGADAKARAPAVEDAKVAGDPAKAKAQDDAKLAAGDDGADDGDGVAPNGEAEEGDEGDDGDGEAGPASKASSEAILGLPALAGWKAKGPFVGVTLPEGPLRVEPKKAGDGELPHAPTKDIEPDTGTFMNHAERFGWSDDGKSFAVCIDSEAECNECIFVDGDGEQDSMELCGPKSPAQARWKAGKYTEGPLKWPAGAEVTIGWESRDIGSDEGPELIVQAFVDGSGAIAELSKMSLRQGDGASGFPEIMALNADGSRLAVVGHGWMGEGTDEWRVRILGTGWLAAEAYHAAGLELLRAGKAADAAALFAKATVADPGPWKWPYNAACAWARAKDAKAEGALAEAIGRGGAAVVAKARTDHDFDGVRGEAWFTALVPAK
jgi:hypothetical protein